ncbi:MAG: TonB-dependent receptor [Marinilabiliaceae bacterium]|nr:TonB-dependent receptor [Marinilabiliaceae bacterium]
MRQLIKQCFAVLGFMMFGVLAMAQQTQTVKGKVLDATGAPIPGANVMIQGTTTGTITDMDGNYVLEVPDAQNAVLVFSFIGFQNQTVPVSNQTTINSVLKDDTIGLDEVVAIGYGVVKKRDLTGAVSSVKAEDITKTASSNAMQSMQGRVPGMDLQQSSGQAGAKVNINLRGNRSLTASNDPLIIVDGVEYGSTLDINPSDIESMDVLKDASSTAIYGTKGANGVIIITTKRGKSGKTKVTANSFISINSPTNVPRVMYGDREAQRLVDKANYAADYTSGNWGGSNVQFADVLTLPIYVGGPSQMDVYNDKSYTDWADIILHNGLTQNYEVAVSGGDDKTNFNISLGSMFEEGLMKNDQMDRYNVKTNIDHKISDHFKVGTSLLYTYKNLDARNASVFSQSLKMTSITHAYDAEGDIVDTPNPMYAAHCNPLLDEVANAYVDNTESNRFFGNAYIEIKPMKDLVFKSMFGVDRSNSRRGMYQDFQSVGRYQAPSTTAISREYQTKTAFTFENTLNYNKRFGSSDLGVLLGQSAKQDVYEQGLVSGSAGAEHYYASTFYDLSKLTSMTNTSEYTKTSMLSFFGRVNYAYNDKYLFNATLRADGSSTVPNDTWGYFPSVQAGWRITEEGFMDGTKNWLTNLKMRASWGIAGNSAVNAYATQTSLDSRVTYMYLDGQDIPSNLQSNMGNPDLKWETTTAINLGLDFGVFNNRVSGSIEAFMSNTNDLLFYKRTPASSAYPTLLANVGKSEGRGIEVSLNTLVLNSSDFSWDVNWSYSRIVDEITQLADGATKNVDGTTGYLVGESVKSYYDYEVDGVWDVGEFDAYKTAWEQRNPDKTMGYIKGYGTPGTLKIVDRNDDGTISADEGMDDRRVYSKSPDHIFGMNNTLTYKRLSLSVLLYARLGGYIAYDMNSQMNYESANWGDLDYWTPLNPDAKFPSPGLPSAIQATYSTYRTALLYEEADYFKVKDITLAYNLPQTLIQRVGIQNLKVYASLKNYFTYSKIENYDPERGGSIAFPLAKQMVFGLNLEF